MRKLMLALLAALAIALLGVACGDDDDGGASPTETDSTATDRATQTEPAETTPANGDQKTPANETPDESTAAPTEPGTQPTPASVGTPATFIEDPDFFSTNYPGKQISESECGFSPVTYVVTCGSDKYAPNPPLTGQDVTCVVLSVDGAPVAIRCTSQEPLQSIYYEIQGS